MFEYGTYSYRGNMLGVKSPDRRIWVMTSCSALSGQMAFKDMTNRNRILDGEELQQFIQLGGQGRHWGFTHTGELIEATRSDTYAEMLARATETSCLLKLGVGPDPFLTTEEGYPYLTDGFVGFRIEWESNRMRIKFPKELAHKVLKMILDPVYFDRYGRVLSPIQPVIDLIEKHEDVLCDPFADRNVGRKQVKMIRQITPGIRQKVRAVTRGSKKEVTT